VLPLMSVSRGDVVGSCQLRQQSAGIGAIEQLIERECRPVQRRVCDDRTDLVIEGMAELFWAPSGPRRRYPAPEGMGRQVRRVRLGRQRKGQSDAFTRA
jgi:hypothetical protein